MLVNRVTHCDFFVYTKVDFLLDTIPFDEEFCSDLLMHCEDFFHQYLLPEIVIRRILNQEQMPVELSVNDEDSTLPITVEALALKNSQQLSNICICGEADYGKMISCKNENCEIGTFHYGCAGIARKPRGDWYCQDCNAEMAIDFLIEEIDG